MAMGKCFHKWRKCDPRSMVADDSRCTMCGDFRSNTKQRNLDFFKDENFLTLWNWAITASSRWTESPFGDWWERFCMWTGGKAIKGFCTVPREFINAERFAKAVYGYLSMMIPDFPDKKIFKPKRRRKTPLTMEEGRRIAREIIQKKEAEEKGEK